jgi:hypothetical protein
VLALELALDVAATRPGTDDLEPDPALDGRGEDLRPGPVPVLSDAPVEVGRRVLDLP